MTTLLLVDDEMDTVDVLRMLLQLEGYQVLAAFDGEEGLRIAEQQLPSLVVTDLMMPRLDGLELARRMRAGPRTRDIPIVLHSASREPVAEGPRPYDAFLQKPTHIGALLQTITAILGAQAD